MIKSLKDLARITYLSTDRIKEIESNVGKYYGFFYRTKKDYVTGKVVLRKNGVPKKRPIHPSEGDLKQLQIYLSLFLKARIILPDSVHGGVKKKGCPTYVIPHISYKYHFCTDLQNFFPTVTNERIEKVFIRIGCSRRLAVRLAKLTTYICPEPNQTKSTPVIPQGSPSADILTNLAFLNTDQQLLDFCKEHNLIYTRYVDDLCFSANSKFTSEIINGLIGIILKNDFKINREKTFSREGTFEAVGIRVNRLGLTLTNQQKEKINYLHSHPEDSRSKNVDALEVQYKKSLRKSLKKSKKKIESNVSGIKPEGLAGL